jgi:hypothetical protein
MSCASDKTTNLKRFNPCNHKGPKFKQFSKYGKKKKKKERKREENVRKANEMERGKKMFPPVLKVLNQCPLILLLKPD